MAGALGVVITTDVPVSGQHAQPVYVDDSLPIVGPSRAIVVTSGEVPQMGGPALPVRLAPAGTPAVGPALPVYVVSGSLISSGGPAFSPTDIAGLQVWFKADALALNNNDPVSSWTDSSGLGHTALQASGTLQPLYKTSQVNGLPSVLFDGSNDYLQTGVFTLSHPCTVFIVLNQVTWTSGDRIHEGLASASTLRLIQITASPQVRIDGTATGTAVNGPAVGAWGLITEVFNAASSSIAINGGADTTMNLGAITTPNGVTLAATNLGGSNANVNIAEMIIYNSALSVPNRASVKAYLNTKYVLY